MRLLERLTFRTAAAQRHHEQRGIVGAHRLFDMLDSGTIGREEIEVTVSCGVAEHQRGEPLDFLINRGWVHAERRRNPDDRRLYAVLDGFAQGQGHLSLTDASYLNAMKVFLQGVTPLEYAAHRHFAYLARHFAGPGPRFVRFGHHHGAPNARSSVTVSFDHHHGVGSSRR